MQRELSLLFTAIVMLLIFQNCSSPSADFRENSQPDAVNLRSENGHPYDGKVYVKAGLCPDGTIVEGRIVMKTPTDALLVRSECQDVEPAVTLGGFELGSDGNSEHLIYKGDVYVVEKPSKPVTPLNSWYIQLQGSLRTVSAQDYDIDLFDTSASSIVSLKSGGHRVICNVAAGIMESWRPDAGSFHASDLGHSVSGSSQERWLNTESANVRSVIRARLDLARSKGCDGVDLDNVDAFSNNSGFPLNAETQKNYNRFLAFAAHDRGLVVALRNVPELVADLEPYFDFAIADECFSSGECGVYTAFSLKGKAIRASEFSSYSSAQCSEAGRLSISLAYFNRSLNGSRYEPCP